jgi:hypothetical protein
MVSMSRRANSAPTVAPTISGWAECAQGVDCSTNDHAPLNCREAVRSKARAERWRARSVARRAIIRPRVAQSCCMQERTETLEGSRRTQGRRTSPSNRMRGRTQLLRRVNTDGPPSWYTCGSAQSIAQGLGRSQSDKRRRVDLSAFSQTPRWGTLTVLALALGAEEHPSPMSGISQI